MIRLFIAVPIPENIRNLIEGLVSELQGVPGLPKDIRFVPPENWHFTLTFLGYQNESAIPFVENSIRLLFHSNVLQNIRIEFERLIYGPVNRAPRMLWLTTSKRTSEELGRIKKSLEDELESKGVKWQRELRPYQAHLTLARFEPVPAKNLPKIERELGWEYETKEIHLMKSVLKRTGAEYEILL
ncbi:MAG: RNA 2',3'-cyclic phosphodiesterase [Candidatus Brennerbacteria bacterium]|nr:RNA 2',3'-cyclic phosphodiesterase [Candidatus Brennerbacteria bacterium]